MATHIGEITATLTLDTTAFDAQLKAFQDQLRAGCEATMMLSNEMMVYGTVVLQPPPVAVSASVELPVRAIRFRDDEGE